jgi:hypothetical protein
MRKHRGVFFLLVVLVLPVVLLAVSSDSLTKVLARKSNDNDNDKGRSQSVEKVLLTGTDNDPERLKKNGAAIKAVIKHDSVVLAGNAPLPEAIPPLQVPGQATRKSVGPDDSFRALLQSNGTVLVNGKPVPSTIEILAGDHLQTSVGSEAKVTGSGFTLTMKADTAIQFGPEPILERGTLLVETQTGLRVSAGCLTVIPVMTAQTAYDVTDVEGTVRAAARKNDVRLESRSTKSLGVRRTDHPAETIIREGQQETRQEKCGSPSAPGAPSAATPAILNSTWAEIAGASAIGGVLTWVLLNGNSAPVSPSTP